MNVNILYLKEMEDITDSGDVTDASTASTKIEDENRLKISEEFDFKQVISLFLVR